MRLTEAPSGSRNGGEERALILGRQEALRVILLNSHDRRGRHAGDDHDGRAPRRAPAGARPRHSRRAPCRWRPARSASGRATCLAALQQHRAQSAGLRVSALSAEISIAIETATANWRNSWPLMPGMKATGTNTDSSTRVMAMIGAGDLGHRLLGRLGDRKVRLLLDHALDVLDDDDGVVDDDADRQHQRQQRHRVGRIADRPASPRRCR